jgi:hypothetical protein
MAFASLYFIFVVVMIAEDFGRTDISTGWNTVGLIVFVILAAASLFEAYRFLSRFANRS